MSVKSSWLDLATVGLPSKEDAFSTLNALRGNTMTDMSQMHLNDSFVEPYGWFCYNKITGNPILTETEPINVPRADVVYTWDNTLGTETLEETRKEGVGTIVLTSLETTSYPRIKLGQTITVADVAGSGNSLMMDADSGTRVYQQDSIRFEFTFKATIPPGEKVELVRTITLLGNRVIYEVPYGVRGLIGTEGEKFNGHNDWGFVTEHLNSPLTSAYKLKGIYTHDSVNYTLNRVSGTGEVKSRAVYVSPRGPDHNIELEIYDGKIPDGPKSGDVGIPGF